MFVDDLKLEVGPAAEFSDISDEDREPLIVDWDEVEIHRWRSEA